MAFRSAFSGKSMGSSLEDIGGYKVKKRNLGHSDLAVSALGLGCMGMSMGYGHFDDADSVKTLRYAIEQGINFIDTADVYGVGNKGFGHNETLIEKVLSEGYRNKVVVATKCGFALQKEGSDIKGTFIDASPQYIKQACEDSLKRLNIDAIDLYYLHRASRNVPIEDSIGALSDLVKSGKVRYIGVSELTEATLLKAAKVHPITALQSEYSLFHRKPEKGMLALCRKLGIGFVPYSPLGRGFLSGKLRDVSTLAQNDFRRILPKFQEENLAQNLKIVDNLEHLAKIKKCTAAQLALAWLLAQGEDIVPIPGTRSIDRLNENIAAIDIKLTKNDLAEIDSLIPDEAAVGARYPAQFDLEV